MKKVLLWLLSMMTIVANGANIGDTFSVNTQEGVPMTFRITSTKDMTCEVYGFYKLGQTSYPAISYKRTGHITIPEQANGYSVTGISEYAFLACSFNSITIPGTIVTIANHVFSGCKELSTIVIPESAIDLGVGIFENCSSLESVTLPSKITEIKTFLFTGCTSLTTVNIPQNVTVIGNGAFHDCKALTTITLPDKLEKIEQTAFQNCTALSLTSFPETLSEIGWWAFNGCNSITSISMPANVQKIGNYSFGGCKELTTVTFSNPGTVIEYSAFSGCSKLKTVKLPEEMQKIPTGLFHNCSSLTSITIPSTVTQIDENAFENCTGLESITIPALVTQINKKAFSGCSNLTEITSLVLEPKYIADNVFPDYSAMLYIPAGTRAKYEAQISWNKFTNKVELEESPKGNIFSATTAEGVQMTFAVISEKDKTCMVYGTKDNPAIPVSTKGAVTIPDQVNGFLVSRVGNYSFYGCDRMKSVTFPSGLRSIGEGIVDGCTSLEKINAQMDFPFNAAIYTFADYDIPLYVPDGRKAVYELYPVWNRFTNIIENAAEPTSAAGSEAYAMLSKDRRILYLFYDNKKSARESLIEGAEFTSVTDRWQKWNNSYISESIWLVVFDRSFAGYDSVTDASDWFNGFKYMKAIVGLEYFNTRNVTNMVEMFKDCTSLTSIDLSHFDTRNVTNMQDMFQNCQSLTSLDLSSFDTRKVESLSYIFFGCEGLKEVNLSSFSTGNVTNMTAMFADCKSLTGSLDLSHFDTRKVTDMSSMFQNCMNLTSVNLDHFNTSAVKEMRGMFTGCSSLTELDLRYFNTSKVAFMNNMFYGCSSLKTIYISNRWATDYITGTNMFRGCTNLVGDTGTTYEGFYSDFDRAHSGEGGYMTMAIVEGSNEDGELEAYAVLSNDNKILTFYYDRKKDFNQGFGIGPFEKSDEREWYRQRQQIETSSSTNHLPTILD